MYDTSTNPQDLSGGTQRLSSGTQECNNVTQDLSIRNQDLSSTTRYLHTGTEILATDLKILVPQFGTCDSSGTQDRGIRTPNLRTPYPDLSLHQNPRSQYQDLKISPAELTGFCSRTLDVRGSQQQNSIWPRKVEMYHQDLLNHQNRCKHDLGFRQHGLLKLSLRISPLT